jgi:hypothetical protein
MKSKNTFDILLKALSDLNSQLKTDVTFIDLTIVGSMAIYLNGLDIVRMTEDIDYINFSAGDDFNDAVEKIAKDNDLPNDWINSRASEIDPLPIELKNRLKIDNRFSNIKLHFIDIETAIIMKVYSYYIRNLEKDLTDLIVLTPTEEQISKGISYIKTQVKHHHGDGQLKKDQSDIDSYKEFLINELL